MRTKLLAQLLHAPRDVDYVEKFQALAAVNLEVRRLGPSLERLLRKAILEIDVGNFGAALTAAQDASSLAPESGEAHFLMGRCRALLAMVKAEALPQGPSQRDPVEDSATGLLMTAAEDFREALRLNPSDEEVEASLTGVEKLVADHPTERELVRALRRT